MTATQAQGDPAATVRLVHAEQKGLRLAILCRTAAVMVGLAWVLIGFRASGHSANPWILAALVAFAAIGVLHFAVIGGRFDRWWLKYLVYAADILGICAVFAFIPPSRGEGVPQILAFRASGIYYLFPLIALACLSLSWRLVLWAGAVAVAGWWTAFALVVDGMERRVDWGDMPEMPARADYESIFLSLDFVGFGTRVAESGSLGIAALVLAVAVYRARGVFFAQIAAEAERETERAARERISLTLGRYVPEAIARRLIADESALAPQERSGAVLVMDVRDFTAFAATRQPREVIGALNDFLARSADAVGRQGGVVISFTGDGLLATFNTPLELAEPEAAALAAARALVDCGAGSGFAVRVGVAAGPVAAGSVGSAQRQAFTVYGDTVNRAARLEALAKELGVSVLVDAAVAAAMGTRTDLRPAGSHALKGLAAPIAVWAVSPQDPTTAP